MNKNYCCSRTSQTSPVPPDHTKEIHRLNRVTGQIEAIKRMISQRVYCPKIIMQIQAVRAALQSLKSVVLEKHLATCLHSALTSRDRKQIEQHIAELMHLFQVR